MIETEIAENGEFQPDFPFWLSAAFAPVSLSLLDRPLSLFSEAEKRKLVLTTELEQRVLIMVRSVLEN